MHFRYLDPTRDSPECVLSVISYYNRGLFDWHGLILISAWMIISSVINGGVKLFILSETSTKSCLKSYKQTHNCNLYTLHEFHSKIPKYAPCNIRHAILFGIYYIQYFAQILSPLPRFAVSVTRFQLGTRVQFVAPWSNVVYHTRNLKRDHTSLYSI